MLNKKFLKYILSKIIDHVQNFVKAEIIFQISIKIQNMMDDINRILHYLFLYN